MRRFMAGLIVLISIGTSQASTTLTNTRLTTIGSSAKIVTKKELVHAGSIRVPKIKVFRSNPFRKSFFISNTIDDDDDIFVQDEDLATGYRRRDLDKSKDIKNDELPEDIRWRLFLARQMAMLKYRERFGNTNS